MIKIYQHFFEELEETQPKLLKDDFVVAYISSPFIANIKNLKNAYAIKIYFTHVTSASVYSYVYAWDALSSIFFGHLFNINTGSDLTIPWEDSRNKRYKYINDFSIKLEEDISFITLKELYETYNFYKKLFVDDNKFQDLHKEFLAVYQTRDGNKIIIPCIVIVQAFYTMSPSNSLFDALINPSGIKSMVKSCEYKGKWESLDDYHMELDGKSHMADKEMLFYFSRDIKHSEYFNKLSYQIQNEEHVKVEIPRKKGLLNIVAEYTRISPDTFYIRNILRSDLKDNDTDNFSFSFFHPKSKYKKKKFDKRDSDYDTSRENSDTDGVVDDNEVANANDTEIIVSAEGINLDSTGESSYNSRQIKKGQEEDRGGRINTVYTDKESKVTFRDKSTNDSESNAKPIKRKLENNQTPGVIEVDGDIWYEEILIELKKYFTVNSQNYLMPINQDKKYTSSFLDKEKKKKRRYVIIEVSGELSGRQVSFLYIDIEKDEMKRRKFALILNKNSIIVDEKKLVQEILYTHLSQWGDIWTKNMIINQKNIQVIMHKHTKTTSSNVHELIKKILKNFT
jgi:hypothetical protein